MKSEPFTVLAIDGGGIRGLYSAVLLMALAERFKVDERELGRRFHLVVGTSTGGLLAASLAAGEPPSRIARLYREKGPGIFSGKRMPSGKLQFILWALRHLNRSVHGNGTLRLALSEIFGSQTLESVYDRNKVALCVTAVNLLDHSPRVFKTPHLEGFDRDNRMLLTDVCLATSAAPLYLPLHRTSLDSGIAQNVFADGGLWMNNPTPLALLEALKMTEPDREIIVLSVGNPSSVVGSNPAATSLDRGLISWKGGAGPLEMSMDSQSAASMNFSAKLADELRRMNRNVTVVRTIQTPVSANHGADLSLDNASDQALLLLVSLAEKDAAETFRLAQNGGPEGVALRKVFSNNVNQQTP